MAATLDQIAREALHLSASERAQLADFLVESLDASQPAELERLWLREALRRRDEIRSGQVEAVPGEEVLAEARRLAKR